MSPICGAASAGFSERKSDRVTIGFICSAPEVCARACARAHTHTHSHSHKHTPHPPLRFAFRVKSTLFVKALGAPGCLALFASVTPFLPGHTALTFLSRPKTVTISERSSLQFPLPGVHPSQSGHCPYLCPHSPSGVPGCLPSASVWSPLLAAMPAPQLGPTPGDRFLLTAYPRDSLAT